MMPANARMYTYIWLCVLVSCILGSQLPLEEDFGFDKDIPQSQTASPLRRLWGIPDAKARVGQLFHFFVPADAFEGPISYYKISTVSGKPLPSWLLFDNNAGLLEGIPEEENVGELYILLQAIGMTPQDTAKDLFAIEIVPTNHVLSSNAKEQCKTGEDISTLTIVIDRHLDDITAKDKITSVKNLAGFLSISYEKLRLVPQGDDELFTDAVIIAGPGNVKKKTSKTSSLLQWQIGCGGKIFPAYTSQVQQLKVNARDGTLAEVIQLPVIGWNLATVPAGPAFRHRREVVGSGDSENDLEEDRAEEAVTLPDIEIEPETRIIPALATPVFLEPSISVLPEVHRHRHQHGESPPIEVSSSLLTSPIPFASIMPTPVYIPERPTILTSIELAIPTSSVFEDLTIVPTATYFVEPSATPEPTTQETDGIFIESSTEHSSTENPTSPVTPDASTKVEEEELEPENSHPVINHKLPKQALTAGKPFRYVIPDFIFSDAEDGNTRSLHLSFKTQEGTPVPPSSWVQFNSTSQEIYALPLEENVSKWIYILEAIDKQGETVQDKLELSVQNHKGRRTVTHQFTLEYDVIDIHKFTTPLDWQLLMLDKLADLYGDPNSSHITVLGLSSTAPFSFTWTNDSLPRNHCPQEELNNLLKVIRAKDDGTPTDAAKRIMAPQILIKNIFWVGKGPCESTIPEVNIPSNSNYPPSPRNQVDILNATVGELLVYTVRDDSFYDPEDGDARYMKLTLLNMDRTKIPSDHWLQFDTSNKEFYGIPKPADVGRKEYQLVCTDSGGKTANDGLVVVVYPARKARYNVEFSIALNMDYDILTTNPSKQRRFVEKISQIFGDKDTNAIVLSGVSPHPTTSVTWHNRSLSTDVCPSDEITQLAQMLITDEKDGQTKPSEHAKRTLGNEFPVIGAAVNPTEICLEDKTLYHSVAPPPLSDDEVRPVSRSDEYLVTVVVPAVVIAGMLLCAGIVACVLYRRRRTNKMTIGTEDERQSFRNKGIPVIFQDELEERPEPTNKSPVIMKEEKPPLPPPEYHQRMALLSDTDHEDSPYQPPPPFTSSRDSSRPKPTPTYRMPPPYVPP